MYLKHVHTNDNEGHAIEPVANISQTPQQYSKFNRVYQILDQEESPQFQSSCIHMGHSDVCHFSHLVLRQCQVQFQDVPRVKTTSTLFRICKNILVSSILSMRWKFWEFVAAIVQRNTVPASSALKCVSPRTGLFTVKLHGKSDPWEVDRTYDLNSEHPVVCPK